MKRLLAPLVLAVLASASPAALAAEQTVKLSVPGMTCASCPYIVEKAISAVDGVKAVEATMEDLSATVTFEDTVTGIEAIQQATAGVGYPSSIYPEQSGS
ncbi:mercury resistance system periplasmic binding protein MerP [Oricola cellulosilytica]|uniref:Periplasmic mercury ion-binding protein n=1 Tax=Oricola cellulosilytica TaxID=1429082 RepID=A0A4R0PEI8_9HYPH|nr:mercury resistance system periplasmic binding protein MerP [Oricola cellulosilytica]TCD16225.1 mercury resistance system periplasmic binding protein MerP [Oricola cellulosilytica]